MRGVSAEHVRQVQPAQLAGASLRPPCRSYEIDKLTASQRLDLNLEKGRMRDELQSQRDKTNELEIKVGAAAAVPLHFFPVGAARNGIAHSLPLRPTGMEVKVGGPMCEGCVRGGVESSTCLGAGGTCGTMPCWPGPCRPASVGCPAGPAPT